MITQIITLHQTGQRRVPRGSAFEINAFSYCTRIIDAISFTDIMQIF